MRHKFELSIVIVVVLGLSLAGVASADSVIKTLYVDGVKVGSATTTQPISYPYQRLTIGAEGTAWYPYNGFVGEMADFAVYGYVLSDANVAAHYSAEASGYQAAVAADNPLLYLKFQDTNTSNGYKAANSGSAPDMNVTYIGAVTKDANSYAFGNAVVFHGATGTGDCIDVCDWSAKLSLSTISVEFWVNTTQTTNYPRLFQHNGSSSVQQSYGAMFNSNSVGLIGGGSTTYVNSTITDANWHHVVVTYNSISPRAYETEVMADDPCLYLKFDNLMVTDSSVNHYWASLKDAYSSIKPVAGAIGGKALYLDNSGGWCYKGCVYTWNNAGNVAWQETGGAPYRSGPGSSNLWATQYALTYDDTGYAAVGAESFEFWFKSAPGLTPDTYGTFFQQIDGMSWDLPTPASSSYGKEPNGPMLGLASGNFRIGCGSQLWYPGVAAPLDGKWHHVVVTYDPNEDNLGHDMNVELYLDGTRYATTVVDPNLCAQLNQNPYFLFMIGAEQNFYCTGNAFGGYIDEFAVYNGVLSANRVATHYAAWQPKNCAEAQARGLALVGDLNGDCQVDLDDFAKFASQWHFCNDPCNVNCGN